MGIRGGSSARTQREGGFVLEWRSPLHASELMQRQRQHRLRIQFFTHRQANTNANTTHLINRSIDKPPTSRDARSWCSSSGTQQSGVSLCSCSLSRYRLAQGNRWSSQHQDTCVVYDDGIRAIHLNTQRLGKHCSLPQDINN